MATVQLAPLVKFRVPLDNGAGATGWKLYTYAAGSSTLLTSYTDASGTTENSNSNPILLDSRGECDLWLDVTKVYKLVVTDPYDAPLWTADNITAASGTSTPSTVYINEGDGIIVSGSGTSIDPFIIEARVDATVGNLIQNSQYGLFAPDYDGKVKVSSIDGHNYLQQKILPGTGVSVTTKSNPQGQYLEISAIASCPGSDSVLNESDVPGANVSEALESLQTDIAAIVDRHVAVTVDDTAPGYLASKLTAGTNINLTVLNPSGDETLEVSADLSGYVPYTGATSSVDLGQNDIKTNSVIIQEGVGNIQQGTLDSVAGNIALTNTLSGDSNRVELGSDGSAALKTAYAPVVKVDADDATMQVTNASHVVKADQINTLINSTGRSHVTSPYDQITEQIANGTKSAKLDLTVAGTILRTTDSGTGDIAQVFLSPDGKQATLSADALDGYVELLTDGGAWYVDADGFPRASKYAGAGNVGKFLYVDDSTGKIKVTTVASSVSVMPIDFSLGGVFNSIQTIKYIPSFSTYNGIYIPTGRTATLKAISMKTQSATSSVAGQTLKVSVRQWTPSNLTQYSFGSGTLIGSERTVYTSDFVGTKYDVCGQISSLSDSLAGGYVYYVDVSQISISGNDLVITLFVEIS